jgi:hypothetical protein
VLHRMKAKSKFQILLLATILPNGTHKPSR